MLEQAFVNSSSIAMGHRSSAVDDGPAVDLTLREGEVMACLVQGLSYKATAASLDIIDTVRTHIRAIYRKLQVRNVAEAVRRALQDRLV